MVDHTRDDERDLIFRQLGILDTLPEREFDALTMLAKRIFGTDISLLTLIDRDRTWFKARCGLDVAETAREPSFCRVAVETDASLVVEDTLLDPRFARNPFVLGQPNVRFYAGVPIRARARGEDAAVPIASLCVIDKHPRAFSQTDLAYLEELANLASGLMEARAMARHSAELAEARRVVVERLERERRQFRQAERMAAIGSWRLSLVDNTVECSEGVFGIYELPIGSMLPLDTALDFYPETDRRRIADAVSQSVSTGRPFEVECDFVTANGNLRRVRSMGEIEMAAGVPVALIGVFQNITDQHNMEQTLLRVSRTDELTRLPNRAEFNRIFKERLHQAEISGDEVAVLLIDLDGFKEVNDTLGHAAGDDILRKVGARLRAPQLTGYFAARLGGDEFAVLAPSLEHRDAFKEFLADLLASLRLTAEEAGVEASISATIGVAWSDGGRLQSTELLRRADAALYAAKRTRKGTARIFSPALMASADGLS